MSEAIMEMLKKYKCESLPDYENALKEIIQHIALLGLARTKFFEKCAFYGGTALRIFFGLDRFSEDLDFSLIRKDTSFSLSRYFGGIKDELGSFGFTCEIQQRDKKTPSKIQSAFIKTTTLQNMIMIQSPDELIRKIPKAQLLKIKFEVDINPEGGFEIEARYLLEPIPFSVTMYKPPYLFAGKMHALFCRKWQQWVKGRDFYDFVWYVAKGIPLALTHLEIKMKASGDLARDTELTKKLFIELLTKRFNTVNIEEAKKDVLPMIKNPQSITVWSRNFFLSLVDKITFLER